ncbi:fibronectin type III domain-containing protein [Dactylosporangium siamense]|uniref:Fibronectin type-III domain-containing protein n=2 Tax=Dactylosporangium siamense TaxID=685454 RepID=A0A919PZK1_9ACTN|nr:hypothetical protein Dsi01nite_096340 [Dactylosporangium siamense]
MREQSGLTSNATGRDGKRVGLTILTAGLIGFAITGGPAFGGLMGQIGATPGPSAAATGGPSPAPGTAVRTTSTPKAKAQRAGDTGSPGPTGGTANGLDPAAQATRSTDPSPSPTGTDPSPSAGSGAPGSGDGSQDGTGDTNDDGTWAGNGNPADDGTVADDGVAGHDGQGDTAAAASEPVDADGNPLDTVDDATAAGRAASAAAGGATAPSAPELVSVTAVDHGLRVAWVHDGSGVDHYVATAYDRQGIADGSCLGALPSTAACDIGAGVAAGGAYVVRVVAYGGAGAVAPSSPASSDVVVISGSAPPTASTAPTMPVVTAPPGGGGVLSAAPGEPVELVVTPGDRQLMVEWRAPWPHDGVAGYTVHVEEDAGLDCVTTEVHCTISGLTNGTPYTVRVRTDGTGGSGGSAWVTAVATPSLAPGEPTGVTAVARIEAITVSWVAGAPGTGVARFQALATSTVGGDQGVCESVDGNTCTISGLKWGDTYTVAVKALGRHGRNSAWSVPAQVATPEEVTLPASVPVGAGGIGSSSGDTVAPGETFTVSGSGFAPHSTVKVALYSDPHLLATTMTDGTGAFSVPVSVPADLHGAHTLVVAGVDGDGAARYLTMALTVAEAYSVTAFGDAGAGMLAVTGDPVGGIAGTGAVMLLAGVALLTLTRAGKRTEGTP